MMICNFELTKKSEVIRQHVESDTVTPVHIDIIRYVFSVFQWGHSSCAGHRISSCQPGTGLTGNN